MALALVFLIIFLMFRLNSKGKAYREEKRVRNFMTRDGVPPTEQELREQMENQREAQYRKDLEKQGYDDDLIAIILPTLMNK